MEYNTLFKIVVYFFEMITLLSWYLYISKCIFMYLIVSYRLYRYLIDVGLGYSLYSIGPLSPFCGSPPTLLSTR